MKYDLLFTNFLNKFDCCAKQIRQRGLALSPDRWNLCVSLSTKKYIIASEAEYTHPLSLILEGRSVNKSIYGERVDYNPYVRNPYPYMQLERIFLLPVNALRSSFSEGIKNNSDYSNHYDDVHHTAFDVGRYCLHKYFGHNLGYNHHPFFERL